MEKCILDSDILDRDGYDYFTDHRSPSQEDILCVRLYRTFPRTYTYLFDSIVNASYRKNIAPSPSFPSHQVYKFLFRQQKKYFLID